MMIANVNYLCHALNQKIVALLIPEEKNTTVWIERELKTRINRTATLSFTSIILETLL